MFILIRNNHHGRTRAGTIKLRCTASGWFRYFTPAILLVWFARLSSVITATAASPAAARIDYDRDIRPILSDVCYACHGPDEKERKAKLRLDQKEAAFAPAKSGAVPVVPGNLAKSELIRRIIATDEDERMPPAKAAKKLSLAQIDLLKRWVEEGAEWKGHWAYVKPERPPPPEVKNKAWPRNVIDRFVLARLEKEGLKPSPEADKARLARRVSLDLTGLPPSVEEVEQYLYDNNSDAYDKLVDRLLASPHYGERMAQFWLDLARYADSQGYHHDAHRDLYHWRDWVISAFNKNMPFDQFTVEQLAGDLLPNATRDQIIATGFHRNEMTTSEGGAMPEEYAVKYVVGRVDTTARVWLGTSLACAECHDHKFDPITQKEYYQFFAFFNTVAENGLDQQENPVPRLTLDTPEQKARLEEMDREVAALENAHKILLESPHPERDAAQRDWIAKVRSDAVESWTTLAPTQFTARSGAALERQEHDSLRVTGTNAPQDVYEVAFRTKLRNITALRLEALPDDALPEKKTGRSQSGDFILTRIEAEARVLASDSTSEPSPNPSAEAPALGKWYALGPFKAASAREAFDKAFGPENGVDLAKSFAEGKLKWTERPEWKDNEQERHDLSGQGDIENSATYAFRTLHVKEPRWVWLSLGSDDGLQLWINGTRLLSRDVTRGAAPDQEKVAAYLAAGENKLLLKVNNGTGDHGFYFRILSEPVTAHAVEFTAAAADYSDKNHPVAAALDDKPGSGWSVMAEGDAGQTAPHTAFFKTRYPVGFRGETEIKVRLKFESEKPHQTLGHFRIAATTSEGLNEFFGLPEKVRGALMVEDRARTPEQRIELRKYYRMTLVPEIKELTKVLNEQRAARDRFRDSVPVTMVMREMEKPRDTFLLVRGNFQQHGEKVTPGVPGKIFPWPQGLPKNRLGLAKWLVDPDNPLTARVTVNHFWLQYFGNGLVKTAEDFGSQGEWPTHPELLDWLATEFIRSKWDVKALQRLIVTSATYRQSSQITPELAERDPETRWLARFPRHRLEAEAIRDIAMAVSGLLNRKIGGPSVYPYQPPGLWEAVAFENTRKYIQSEGAESYRRGLYTYWRRSLPYPSLITFDAPTRETCTVRRPRTNTPLQALVLMNDPVYVEASRAFGQRILREGGGSFDSRLSYAFKLALSRNPTRFEKERMESSFSNYLKNFEADRVAASKLINVGAARPPVEMDICELAAWTVLANTLLNLDETITKG